MNEHMRLEITEIQVCINFVGTHTNDAKVLHEAFVTKVTGSLTNNVKALNETFFAEVTDSNPV
jgi:hypothetical protein